MAVVGTLGGIVFSVSRRQVLTFDGMQWDSSTRYATHNRHLKDPLLEFTGIDADTVSFTMIFSVFLGVNPQSELAALQAAQRNGDILRLVLGRRAYGSYKWVITKLSRGLERFDNKGNLLHAKVTVSLMAYAQR